MSISISAAEILALPGVQAAFMRKAEAGANAARSRAAVDTGAMRASVYAEPTANGSRFGARVPHAVFVEYGTSKMRAQPFIRPSMNEAAAG